VPGRVMAALYATAPLRSVPAGRGRRRIALLEVLWLFLCMHKRRPYRRGLGNRDGGERQSEGPEPRGVVVGVAWRLRPYESRCAEHGDGCKMSSRVCPPHRG